MEEAWLEHVGKLTADQLGSVEDLRAHLNQFQVKLVSEGLHEPTLCGMEDIHRLIAKLICDVPLLPHASVMKILAHNRREIIKEQVVQEILAMIQKETMEGGTSIVFFLDHC